MARPTELNDDVALKIAGFLEEGNSISDSCAMVGVAEQTYHNWIARGETGEEPFLGFLGLTRAARAKGRNYHVKIIKDAAVDDWRASSFFLERSDPDHWGRQEKIKQEVSGKNGEPLPISVIVVNKPPNADAHDETT
jgi:hypothetical protein